MQFSTVPFFSKNKNCSQSGYGQGVNFASHFGHSKALTSRSVCFILISFMAVPSFLQVFFKSFVGSDCALFLGPSGFLGRNGFGLIFTVFSFSFLVGSDFIAELVRTMTPWGALSALCFLAVLFLIFGVKFSLFLTLFTLFEVMLNFLIFWGVKGLFCAGFFGGVRVSVVVVFSVVMGCSVVSVVLVVGSGFWVFWQSGSKFSFSVVFCSF